MHHRIPEITSLDREQIAVADRDQRAQRGLGRRQADAEEGQGRLGDHGKREIDGEDVQQWADRNGDWKNWLAAAGYPGVPFERGLVFETADLVLNAAKQGAGIGIGDHAYIREDLLAGLLISPFPITVSYDRGYFIKARDDEQGSEVRSAFVDFMIRKTAQFNEG